MPTEPTVTTIERIAWMFPGEGAHRPLMARRLTGSRALFDQARAVCGAELYRLCAVDRTPWWPEEAAQLAIFVTSLAAARALERAGLAADGAVGHGLGELTALVATGALSFPDALEAVHTRAKTMSSVGRGHGGGMMTVSGLAPEEVEEVCARLPGVWVAGYNSPVEVAVSGDEAALAAAAVRLRKAGARVIRIEAPYARHSSSMAPVRHHLADLLQGCPIGDPQTVFYSTVDAGSHAGAEAIRRLVPEGVLRPVLFAQAVRNMWQAGFTTFVEMGAGALGGPVRAALPDARVLSVESDEDAAALGEELRQPPASSEAVTPVILRSLGHEIEDTARAAETTGRVA